MFKRLVSCSSSLLAALAISIPSHALSSNCGGFLNPHSPNVPLTPAALSEMAQAKIDVVNRLSPPPKFLDLAVESKTHWVGAQAPKAIQELLATNVEFEAVPAPNSEHPMAVNLIHEGKAVPYKVNMTWRGKPTNTIMYASLPAPITEEDNKFIVGKKYKYAAFHIHGGGTPTASGKNAMSIGKFFERFNIPVIAPDMPGHGKGSRVPMLTFVEQMNYVLALADEVCDPDVKIFITGHSWGAEFAIMMNRLAKLNPKYKRIVGMISLAAPIDMSLGRNDDSKDAFEDHFHKNLSIYESRIAETDFDFLKNMVENGKVSSIGSRYTYITHFGYSTPPLTREEYAELPPMMVIMAENDGLCYVGREREAQEIFGTLPPGCFYVMPPGYRFKKKHESEKPLVKTGHGGMLDRYRDGTDILEAYTLMKEFILKDETNLDENALATSPARKMLDEVLRSWANWFPFRELVDNFVHYDLERMPTFEAVTKRKVELMEYQRDVTAVREQMRKKSDQAFEVELQQLKAKLGADTRLTLERAQWELSLPPFTEDRKQILQNFLAEVRNLDTVRTDDSATAKQLDAVWKEFEKPLRKLGVESLSAYKPRFHALNGIRGKVSPEQEAERRVLSQVHNRVVKIESEREKSFNVAREAKIKELAEGKNIVSDKAARRELEEVDRSPERRALLEKFVLEQERLKASIREKFELQAQQEVAAISLPEGINSADEVAQVIEQTNALSSFRFVPENQPEIQSIVNRLLALDSERRKHTEDEKSLKEMEKRSSAAITDWESLWKEDRLTSPQIENAKKKFYSTLDAWIAINTEKEEKLKTFLKTHYDAGTLTEDLFINLNPELQDLHKQFEQGQMTFMKAREELDLLKWSEALEGQLVGSEADVFKATQIASLLRGSNSLTSQVKALREQLELAYRTESLAEQDREFLQWQYMQLMKEAGYELPQMSNRIVIKDLLNMSYLDLVRDLESNPAHMHAFTKMMRKWNEMVREIRTDYQVKTLED